MSKGIIVIISIVVISLGALIWLNNTSRPTAPALTFDTVQRDVAGGGKLYDVRTNEEFTASHFKNATNWPVTDMAAGKLPDIAKETRLYVYCRSGNRSSQATTLLKKAGFTNVIDLGGLAKVESIGGTLIK